MAPKGHVMAEVAVIAEEARNPALFDSPSVDIKTAYRYEIRRGERKIRIYDLSIGSSTEINRLM